jgi:hypothetical protein
MSDTFAHCRSAERPGTLWLWLVLLGNKHALPDDLLHILHKRVRTALTDERQGAEVLMERLEREARERNDRGAPSAIPKWVLMGFSSVRAYVLHIRDERRHYAALEAERVHHSLPEWRAFGFVSVTAFERYRKRLAVSPV